ncbi:MAG TPA: hypothetical protein VM370_01225, partial [Candidatus Thermoplasmatota archaeon]|nr:hypothetical protein [Candidatus Thermoplasmatota archaeon]
MDAYFEVAPIVQHAREAHADAAMDRLGARFTDATFCWADDALSVRATNAGDDPIDTLNMSFLVDGALVDGFATDVAGSTASRIWTPGEYARFNRTDIATEPERISATTGAGTRITFARVTCPVLASILVTPTSATLHIGETRDFVARGYDQYGARFDPGPFTWSSDCGSASDLNATYGRLVAGTVAGPCTMTATAGVVSGDASITILPDAPATITVAPDPYGIAAGGSRAFAATALDAYGNVNATAPIAWTTNAGSISGAGVLTAQTTAQMGRSVTATWTTVSGVATVDVYAAAPDSIDVTPDGAGVTAGGTQAYAAVIHDVYGNVNGTAPLAWSTDAGSISSAGLLTAQTTAATGKTVTATSGAVSSVVDVDIIAAAPSTIAVTPSLVGVPAGGSQAFTAVVSDAYGNVNTTATITWSTNGGSITSGGALTAQTTAALGKSVTATSGSASGVATLDVYPAAPATALTVPDGAGVTAGGTRLYSVTLYDAYGNVNGTAPVTWSTNAGSITSGGTLTAQTTAATGKSVTATSGAASDAATVDIIAAAPSTITLTPSGAGVTAGTTRAYAAVVRDAYGNVNSTATVSWSTTGGSISSSGVLTAQTTAATGKYVNATSGA